MSKNGLRTGLGIRVAAFVHFSHKTIAASPT